MTGRCGFPKLLSTLSFFSILALCMVSGCLLEQVSENNQMITGKDTLTGNQRDEAIDIALNDREVHDYLKNGYTLKNVGPLCYEQSPGDGNIYKSCFTGVEFETKDVYLVVYVDQEKHVVNSTSMIYIRNPVVAP